MVRCNKYRINPVKSSLLLYYIKCFNSKISPPYLQQGYKKNLLHLFQTLVVYFCKFGARHCVQHLHKTRNGIPDKISLAMLYYPPCYFVVAHRLRERYKRFEILLAVNFHSHYASFGNKRELVDAGFHFRRKNVDGGNLDHTLFAIDYIHKAQRRPF